jgi:O-antigen/teichoic acid export membrane protein
MRTTVLQWIRTNSVILLNAGSLIGTTAVTSLLGFAYWWLAARQFTPHAVGLASAAVSAMMLLGSICVLGMGTLLIGELPRQRDNQRSLISTALILVGSVGGIIGTVFALFASVVSPNLRFLHKTPADMLLFAVGVSLTSLTIVLDQSLIGLLRGGLQLWRNTLFAIVKLVALFCAGFLFSHSWSMLIYATWALGNALSLLPLVCMAVVAAMKRGRHLSAYLPRWKLLRKLGASAIEHHLLNLTIQAPALTLPLLVTVLLSPTMNAWFYVSWMIASFVFVVPNALTTVLYATNSSQPEVVAPKIRLTLGLAFFICTLADVLVLLDTSKVLGLFGHVYANQATWTLRILCLGVFPLIIKNHYVAVCRIQNRIRRAMWATIPGVVVELFVAAIGAQVAGLTGLSIGWLAVITIEAIFMAYTVFRSTRYTPPPVPPLLPSSDRSEQQYSLNESYKRSMVH